MVSTPQPEPSQPRRSRGRILTPLLLGAILLTCCCIIAPCVQKVRDTEGWIEVAFHLNQCGLAMQNYNEVYGHLPPNTATDKNGRPLYSWRVALLPFLEEDSLYKEFHLDEPWDSPHNKRFLEKTPRCFAPFQARGDPKGMTRFQVLVGPGTAFERDGLTFNDFPDGVENTILLVETANPVPWTKPEDVAYGPNEPLPQFTSHRKSVEFMGRKLWTEHGFVACFANGRARFINNKTPEPTIRALITRNGGEKVDASSLE